MTSLSTPHNLGQPAAPRPQPPRSWLGQVGYRMFGRIGAVVGFIWILIVAFFAIFAPFIASSFPIAIKTKAGWSSPILAHLYPSDVVLLVGTLAFIAVMLARRWRGGLRLAAVAWVVFAAIPLTCWRVWEQSWPGWIDSLGMTETIIIAAIVGLVLAAAIILIPWRVKATWRQRLCVLIPILVLAGLLSTWPVLPPRVIVYSTYREQIASGQIQQAYYTAIPYSPSDRLRDLGDMRLLAPSAQHIMGTTEFGEDMASRMIHACRIALAVGFIATGIAVIIGVIIGGFMGYFSGIVDLLGMRLVEVFNAIPTIFLLIAIVAFYGRNLYLIMVVIGFTTWIGYALFVRAEFLKLRDQEFVLAARASGIPLRSILFKHMLPNGIAPVVVTASFGVASAIILEATLSFLGLGLVSKPSWGQMLNQARGVGGSFYWWIALYPGAAIFLTVFAYNLVGEALRDTIDPHTQGN